MASTNKGKTGRSNPRKSHRKSRLGCVECKRRRIKCDEGKPSCSFCTSRAVRCRFPPAPPSNQHSPAASTNSPSNHGMQSIPAEDCVASIDKSNSAAFSMDLEDTILFHHYCTFTCSTFGRSKDTQDFWRCVVAEVGFDYPFLLHAILSVSALHMAHLKENADELYLPKANEHWDIALRSATSLLSDINEHNCHALYIFAMLSCFQTLARGPKPGNFLLFGNGDNAEWLIFFRGLRSISQVLTVASVHRGAAAIIWNTALRNFEDFSSEFDPALEPEPIADLRQLLARQMAGDPDWPTYITTLNQLSMCFSTVFDGSQAHATTHAKDVFAWMHNISDHFILCLQQHQPAALTLFAYFAVLIKQMERGWMMHGWSSHLLSGIYDAMEPSKTLWLRWPMENIGWLPSS